MKINSVALNLLFIPFTTWIACISTTTFGTVIAIIAVILNMMAVYTNLEINDET